MPVWTCFCKAEAKTHYRENWQNLKTEDKHDSSHGPNCSWLEERAHSVPPLFLGVDQFAKLQSTADSRPLEMAVQDYCYSSKPPERGLCQPNCPPVWLQEWTERSITRTPEMQQWWEKMMVNMNYLNPHLSFHLNWVKYQFRILLANIPINIGAMQKKHS